ncbi:branched-chain amino acid ABC transporter permease [Phreatobacter stygius]|uniref:Branched-chain amino acid ABC transporter permease n=2 Tax=Phreatobacter stygius TaxID=1940610 RepID=A0A4D7BEM1_9HYPH|nr:branched-chain amino acid ABC transporter permease [Phreatobacter stygius]
MLALAACLAVGLALPFVAPLPLVDRLVFAAIYGIAGLGVGLLLGQCGILNLAQALFYGIGAYATAYASVELGWPPAAGFAAGLAVSGALAFAIGWPTLRLNGYFLALATLALGIAGHELFFEWDWLTGGTFGIGGIPPIRLAGLPFNTPETFYYIAWAVFLAALFLARNLIASRNGLAMQAMRDAPDAAAVLGIDMHRLKAKMFVVSAMLGAVAGSLFAHYVGFVSVQSFGVERSIQFLLIPVVGGARSLVGMAVGAIFIALVPELLSHFGEIHHVLFGLALVAVVIICPDGIAGLWQGLRARIAAPRTAEASTKEPNHAA